MNSYFGLESPQNLSPSLLSVACYGLRLAMALYYVLSGYYCVGLLRHASLLPTGAVCTSKLFTVGADEHLAF